MSKSGSPSGAGHSLERQDSSGVMDSLECLPDEIVVLIPGQRPPALCALMATCSRFRVLASDEAIWQACHKGRWTYGRPSKPPACGEPSQAIVACVCERTAVTRRILDTSG